VIKNRDACLFVRPLRREILNGPGGAQVTLLAADLACVVDPVCVVAVALVAALFEGTSLSFSYAVQSRGQLLSFLRFSTENSQQQLPPRRWS